MTIGKQLGLNVDNFLKLVKVRGADVMSHKLDGARTNVHHGGEGVSWIEASVDMDSLKKSSVHEHFLEFFFLKERKHLFIKIH